MPMNATTVIRHLKRKMGASHFPLPIDDEEIIEIVKEESLPTFSTYFPYYTNLLVDPKLHSTGESGCYYLYTDNIDLEIIGVAQEYRNDGNFFSYIENQNINTYNTDLATLQILTNFSSAVEVPRTFQFHAPNVVEVFPKNINATMPFIIKVKAIHPSHFGTIPMTLKDEFLKLALYDVQYSIYSILKHYEGMGTAFGNIALKTEEFEAADANRKDLLENWDTKYLKESNRKKIWIS